MARPRKKGLDYFSIDVNFFNDIKIRKLLRRKGAAALCIYQILLCEIYRQGYSLPYDENLPFLISETSGVKEEEIEDIILLCLEIGLFDRALYEKYHLLTSESIKEVYFADSIVKMREYRKKHISINETSITNNETIISNIETPITINETNISNIETPITINETNISNIEMTSVKRKTIKKETSLSPSPYTLKEKNNKKKNPPTTTTARMREGGNSERGDETLKRQELTMPVSQGVAELLQDSTWLSNVQKLFNISSVSVTTWLQVFSTECVCRDNEIHESLSDIKRHFVDWLKKKDLSKESALSALSLSQFAQASQYSTSDTRKMTGAQRKWETLKKYLSANVEKSDQPLVAQLEFGGFYPAFNKLVIKVPTNEIVDRLEQKYANQLKTAITYEYGKPNLEYNIAPSVTPQPPP